MRSSQHNCEEEPWRRRWAPTRHVLAQLCFVLTGSVLAWTVLSALALADPATDRADQLFLTQLTERQFFELAEQHCRKQQGRATTIEQKADWQLRLCQVYEQHAWFAASASRGELLNLSVQQISELLQQDHPSPEKEFLLRIQQAHALGQSIRIGLILGEAGHLFGRSIKKPANTATSAEVTANDAHAPVLNQAIELTESLLKQLEQMRKDLDVQMVREIRDRARLQLAELHALKWQVLFAEDPIAARSFYAAAEDAVDLAIRSVRNPVGNAMARALLAELAVVAGDAQEFQLRIRSVEPTDSSDEVLRPEFLSARSLLSRQEATEATRVLESVTNATGLQRQHLAWLKLECMLGVCELVRQLDDADLITEASAAFEQQLQHVRQTGRGVFLEAAEATSRRFILVDEVGVVVADLVEQVERYRAGGKPVEALRLIDLTLQRLPSDASPRARAALLLRSGELLIARKQWDPATERLDDAVHLFREADMSQEQAVADLLRIYVMARKLATEKNTVTQIQYTQALEQHLQKFPQQSTSNRAREWLLRVVETADPTRAAALSLEMLDTEKNPQRQIAVLEQAARLLSADHDTESSLTRALHEQLTAHVQAVLEDPDRYPVADLVFLRMQLLELKFQSAAASDLNWNDFRAALRELRSQLSATLENRADEALAAKAGRALQRWELMDTVVATRITSDPKKLAPVNDRLMETPDDQLAATTTFLYQHYQQKPHRIGDVWLARRNEKLLERLLQTRNAADTFAQQKQLLQMITLTASVTEDTSLRDRYLKQIVSADLNSEQLSQVAVLLANASDANPPHAGAEPAIDLGVQRFWRNVATQQTQGSPLWLEAQLQIASAAFKSGRINDARKQLGVVNTLYPEWGSAQRKLRAENLIQQLAN